MKNDNKKLNKKGISGIEISVAIVVISLGLSVIVSMFLIIAKTINKVNREIEATQIAKSVLERIKVMPYSEFLDMVLNPSIENYFNHLGLDIPTAYTLDVEIVPKAINNEKDAIRYNISKQGNVVIRYMTFNTIEEVKLPYVKYFDRVYPKNKPDLTSKAVVSSNTYTLPYMFIPVTTEDEETFTSIDQEDLVAIKDWYNHGIGDESLKKKYVKCFNTDGQEDILYWEPRNLNTIIGPVYLLGRTFYTVESYIKTIQYPGNNIINILITSVEEKEGTASAGDEEGAWVYLKTI